MTIRIVSAEDSYLVREGTRLLLETQPDVELVSSVGTLPALLTAVDEHTPDVVLTDIRMPPTETHPGIGVVVLSQYVEPEYALRLFGGGARGRAYLLKERLGDLAELRARAVGPTQRSQRNWCCRKERCRLDVNVRVLEVGEGEPTLFVHASGPNSASTWMQLAARMSGLRCLLLDRPGTGLSSALPEPVRPHNWHRYAETLIVDVLDALQVERAHLVGSSLGGTVAIYTAAAHPDRVDRTVQLASPALAPGGLCPPFMRLGMTPGVGRLMGMLPPTPRAVRMMFRQIGHGASLDTGRIPDAFIEFCVAHQRDTDIPTYFLWGEDDAFGGRDVAEALVSVMPDAQLEMLPCSGHQLWLDDPDHVAQAVMAHLLPSGPPPGSARAATRTESADAAPGGPERGSRP